MTKINCKRSSILLLQYLITFLLGLQQKNEGQPALNWFNLNGTRKHWRLYAENFCKHKADWKVGQSCHHKHQFIWKTSPQQTLMLIFKRFVSTTNVDVDFQASVSTTNTLMLIFKRVWLSLNSPELPDTSFTRSISNPEAVMRRRRQQKLEKKLQQYRSKVSSFLCYCCRCMLLLLLMFEMYFVKIL